MRKRNRRSRPTRKLPASTDLELKSATLETRRRPRVQSESGRQTVSIREAVVTVLDPGSCVFLARGMCFRIESRKIVADRISLKERKYRTTNSHHRFLLVAHGARIIGIRKGVYRVGNQ